MLVAVSAVGAGITLLVAGSRLPQLGPVLLLAIVAALCVNRFALFPNEHAATAEAAVLLAAVVGFRSDAAFLGPLAVALLVGPLDALHWEQRAFVRMAYNAGNRGLSTLCAAAVFAGTRELLGHTTIAWVASVVLAAAAFTVVDVGLSITLLRIQGDRLARAFAHLIDIDALTFPIACVGAAAGILAGQVGWWATAMVLLPAAFLPELVIARARVRAVAVLDLALLLSLVAMLAVIALVSPVASTVTLALLVVIAVLAGAEFTLRRGALIPPMVATVTALAVVVGGDDVRTSALLVGVVATGTAWWCGSERLRVRFVGALAVAAVGGLLAAEAATALERSGDSLAVTGFVAALVFALTAVLASGERRRGSVALVWSLPVLAAAAGWAALWSAIGVPGAAVWVALMGVTLVGAGWWGAPPWRARWSSRVRSGGARLPGLLVALGALVAVAAAAIGSTVTEHSVALAWGWVSSGSGEAVVVMTACGVRQWRLAPRARVRGLVVTSTAAAILIALVPRLVADGSWAGLAVVTITIAAVLLESRIPGARAAATVRARAEAERR
jgi:hypothetical protein